MIIQPTAAQTRRIERARIYSGPGFGPRSFECLGLGISLGLGHSPVSAGPSNFGGYFQGRAIWQTFQTDQGFTYGGTLRAVAGNTSTTVVTLTGAPTGGTIPIRAKATNTLAVGAGAQFSIYSDGGTTPFMTGVTPTAATPVALTGVGAGASLTWSAGTGVTNDAWDATCAGLADLNGITAANLVQANVTKQGIVTVGVNGRRGILLDGVDDFYSYQLASIVAPATQPVFFWLAFKQATYAGKGVLADPSGAACLVFGTGSTPGLQLYDGSFGPANSGAAIGSLVRLEAYFDGSTGSFLKLGSTQDTPGNCGNAASSINRYIGSQGGTVQFANIEFYAGGVVTGLPSAAERLALSTALAAAYTGIAI